MSILKTLAIFLLCVSLAQSQQLCNASCTCDPNSYVCNGCSDPNGDVNQLWNYDYRFCPCMDGYYISDYINWTCSPIPLASTFDWCDEQITFQILGINVQTNCHPYQDPNTGAHYVQSDLNLDYNGLIHIGGCMYDFTSQLMYQDPTQPGNPYVPFPSNVLIPQADQTLLSVRLLLSDIAATYSMVNTISGSTINNQINIGIKLGTSAYEVRLHEYSLFVYTLRDEVYTFQVNVSKQNTADCTGSCIVIADLDVYGQLTDSTYTVVQTSNQYTVGGRLYGRVLFRDATFSKQLILQNLYFKGDNNAIYDMTAQTHATPIAGGLDFYLDLAYPSMSAIIQLNMKIQGVRRFLQTSSSSSSSSSTHTGSQATPTTQTVQSQFTISITNPISSASSTTTAAAASSGNNADASNSAKASSALLSLSFFALLLLFI